MSEGIEYSTGVLGNITKRRDGGDKETCIYTGYGTRAGKKRNQAYVYHRHETYGIY